MRGCVGKGFLQVSKLDDYKQSLSIRIKVSKSRVQQTDLIAAKHFHFHLAFLNSHDKDVVPQQCEGPHALPYHEHVLRYCVPAVWIWYAKAPL